MPDNKALHDEEGSPPCDATLSSVGFVFSLTVFFSLGSPSRVNATVTSQRDIAHADNHNTLAPPPVAFSMADRDHSCFRRRDQIHAQRGRKASVGNGQPVFLALARLFLFVRRRAVLCVAQRIGTIKGKT